MRAGLIRTPDKANREGPRAKLSGEGRSQRSETPISNRGEEGTAGGRVAGDRSLTSLPRVRTTARVFFTRVIA